MRKKCDVTASEMLEMRNQGLSNRDIANCLDISYATVLKYIGKQGGHMDNLAAFADPPRKKKEVKEEMHMIPKYEPKPVMERFVVGGCGIIMDTERREISISSGGGEILAAYEDIPNLVQFLAWAMRTRINIGDETPTL